MAGSPVVDESVAMPLDRHGPMHAQFRWAVPARFNIAQQCCTRWAGSADAATRVAILVHRPGQAPQQYSYAQLQQAASRLSNVLLQQGVKRGDRVAIVLPQRFETAVANIAVLQMGAVAMPLSMLFGPEALEYRLQDSGAVLALSDENSIDNLLRVRARCPELRCLLAVGLAAGRADLDYEAETGHAATIFKPVRTRAVEPALLIYTSGTTGPPKGALVPHQALLGNLPGFVCSQNWFGFDPWSGKPAPSPARGRAGVGAGTSRAKPSLREPETRSVLPEPETHSVFWSPADWAWTGGLMDALLPSLYFGRPIVAWRGRFSPDLAFELMQQHAVTHTFLFPTALKAMMKAYPEPRSTFDLRLQGIMSAGEAVGDAVFAYCQQQLGVTVNEMFGQTEINYIVGNCAMDPRRGAGTTRGTSQTTAAVGWPAKPGSMGRPYPGHRVAVLDELGVECPVGVPGDVALHRCDRHGHPDPVFFLGYWRNPKATAAKFTGDWCRTGDMAIRDNDGYLWYQGRSDDLFKSAGYRIGPGEIENCLVKHPAVANAAVVPKPDRERGALVKAYVVLTAEAQAARHGSGAQQSQHDADLIAQLQAHVKDMLAPYEYPKEIEFIDALPMTTTGKVQRCVLRLQEEERALKLGTLSD